MDEQRSVGADLHIRQYEPADTDRVWAVHEAALRASGLAFVEDAPQDADIRDIEAEYLDGRGTFLVGETDGEIAAMGGLQFVTEQTTEIRRMRVHPDYQRQGFGRQVLSALEATAREHGARTVALSTHEDLVAAQAFYQAAGYEHSHSKPNPVTGDALLHYEKRLE
jgi:GNAT superfamily N-acetyltransferase